MLQLRFLNKRTAKTMVAPTIIDYLKYAAVGAAIGRPPAKIRSDVKQHASAKKNIAIVTGRASVRNGRAMLAPTMNGCS